MTSAMLLVDLLDHAAARWPSRPALTHGATTLPYAAVQQQVLTAANGLAALGLQRGQRVALYLDKCIEMVVVCFGVTAAGGVFVPVNPVLKPEQVAHILRDSGACILVTSSERLERLAPFLESCASLHHVVCTGVDVPRSMGVTAVTWPQFTASSPAVHCRGIDHDMAAILYTSGSTGLPKGVVLSHRNLVAGATSVAAYLGHQPDDSLLAVLPLSFDAGFSQLTTAFASGARVVLLNYLLPRDVLKAMAQERVTGLTAVPPMYIQLAALQWPEESCRYLRYFANTGGHLPRETLARLRLQVPTARPFLMYGLTEAFRSTYLPPEEVDRRPDSIGKAIPNAEILVLREDGTRCAPDEPGELVHRGALVGLGYWNDPAKTAERYRPLPQRESGLPLPEIAVFSGDTVRMDEDGFLYFIGRRDEMIKSSGYRISPTEVEDVLYGTQLVGECAAFGVPHATLGQTVQVVATPADDSALNVAALLSACRATMPAYMVPAGVQVVAGPLPRNPNGKIDRRRLAAEWNSTDA